MPKPPKLAPVPPAPVSYPGIAGYLSDIGGGSSAALEALGIEGGLSGIAPDNQPETTVIDKKDGVYHVYFHTGELSTSWCTTNLNAFTQFAMSLTAEDVVYFYQTGSVHFMPSIAQALIVLDTLCLAQKVFVVDHLIETPLLLLVCNKLAVEDTGAITFSSCIPDDHGKAAQIFRPYMSRLYKRAVGAGLLSAAEAKSVIDDNGIVFKTARELRRTLKPAMTET
jgi:hypothetical protein